MKKNKKEPYEIASEICMDVRKAKQCVCWDKFDSYDWRQMLGEHPELASKADAVHAWRKFDAYDWQAMILEQPVMIKAYQRERSVDMDAGNWLEILKKHPNFLDICPAAKELQTENENYGKYFTFGDWLELLVEQPQLEEHVPWESEKIDEGYDEFIGAWLRLITAHINFAQRLDWKRAENCLDGEIWKNLLTAHPEYEKYCPWDKLPAMEWWPLFKYCPQYFKKCQCTPDVPVRAWAYLLCQRPELSKRFCRWSQLTVNEWASLLKRQPQLADECLCLDKVKELPDDESDTDDTEGLKFPCGDEWMDIFVDSDFQQRNMEYNLELIQSLEQSSREQTGEE